MECIIAAERKERSITQVSARPKILMITTTHCLYILLEYTT
ncbi:hypothetical protein PMI16_04208 [Herbaspirillum sp. CF444]|nr:hypothetical protein PMI16_04208 [Herbaspirillum sp. CF444]